MTPKSRNLFWKFAPDLLTAIVVFVVFIVPFIFIILTAAKPPREAGLFRFEMPSQFMLFQNLQEVMNFKDGRMWLATTNSTILTVSSITLIVLVSALVAFVLQRRQDRYATVVSTILAAGLIIPPAVVPTIFVLQKIGLYKTLIGLILIEVAYAMPFAILLFRAFMASIPTEIDEAAIIDGASPLQVFFRVILPLLRPAMITIIITSSVAIYNDFTNPLYFLPGDKNVTAQLTLFSFISQFNSRYDLLFANVIIITIPPFIMFMFFQRQIVSGMTSGAVKG